MTQLFTLPAHPEIAKAIGREAKVHYALFDSPAAFADYVDRESGADFRERRPRPDRWIGDENAESSLAKARCGDLSRVAPSDALLDKFEKFAFATTRRAWADDVTGAMPNVPAFIAGHPLSMRRRIKRQSTAAPLAVIVSLSSSASISATELNRRGAAILALVRVLSASRPVELWAGSTLDADSMQNAYVAMARIETAPLDLATAAHCLVSPSFDRGLGHQIGFAKYDYAGDWPFGSHTIAQTHCQQLLAPGFPHVSEALCIPPVLTDDIIVKNPEKWIAAQLTRYAIDAFAE